jgi:hypothetical protein
MQRSYGVEVLQMSQRREERVLHQVHGVLHSARGRREPSVRPSPERRQAPHKQHLEGLIVAVPHTFEQVERGFRIKRGQMA